MNWLRCIHIICSRAKCKWRIKEYLNFRQIKSWVYKKISTFRNRDIAKSYTSIVNSNISGDVSLFHDINNPDAIIECILTPTPNFEDQSSLIDAIDQGVEKLIMAINDRLWRNFEITWNNEIDSFMLYCGNIIGNFTRNLK